VTDATQCQAGVCPVDVCTWHLSASVLLLAAAATSAVALKQSGCIVNIGFAMTILQPVNAHIMHCMACSVALLYRNVHPMYIIIL